jgi:hypothetical protein
MPCYLHLNQSGYTNQSFANQMNGYNGQHCGGQFMGGNHSNQMPYASGYLTQLMGSNHVMSNTHHPRIRTRIRQRVRPRTREVILLRHNQGY